MVVEFEKNQLYTATTFNQPPKSLNWHIFMKCNYSCKFCFKTYAGYKSSLQPNSKEYLSDEKVKIILKKLKEAKVEKITFAGGEPTLYPYLPEVLKLAKEMGFVTMIVTNSSLLTDMYLDKIQDHIDYVKLSIDSSYEGIQKELGRGKGDHIKKTLEAGNRLKNRKIKVMMNTVVTLKNINDDMSGIVEKLSPVRWKVFQALPEKGENDNFKWWCSKDQFESFIKRHEKYDPVAEPNNLMRGSYVIMDPIGRFMNDETGQYHYSDSILYTDVLKALGQVGWNYEKFKERGGEYEW